MSIGLYVGCCLQSTSTIIKRQPTVDPAQYTFTSFTRLVHWSRRSRQAPFVCDMRAADDKYTETAGFTGIDLKKD
jgi:hypothetical protein